MKLKGKKKGELMFLQKSSYNLFNILQGVRHHKQKFVSS